MAPHNGTRPDGIDNAHSPESGPHIADGLPPEYALILRDIPASEANKAEFVRRLRTVVRQVIRRCLEERDGMREGDQ
ncbi:hypothetical protein CCAX7_61830 [Capsulimonas corticalis]|uniref:Uncharacterized protein n=1 Tax=Capsulimonas corticalis TaxID=2219043 RepID=A0A402CWF1_9BACT|nr:hypothetical protein [Capsulimonas corticalis]BDI34132.1 hypothetical protein CCAX7_61830 [Capsulimonas corticalis]